MEPAMSASASRRPQAAEPARIAPLATLPLFHKLAGRRVVLAAGGEAAVWKAELLLAAGAAVHVFAPVNALAFMRLQTLRATADGFGTMAVHSRKWTPDDLAEAALAIAETPDGTEAAAFATAARDKGVPVNIIDRPAFCDFQFGAIVNRSPLVIGISTDGAAPVFGQAIRMRIEALLPNGMKRWAEAARDWRPAVQARELSFALRRRFWERFTSLALAESGRQPAETDRTALLDLARQDAAQPQAGKVIFVGAGPGDPDLLTIKAVRMLQSADVILYDDLVSAEVLELARREATRMRVGKTGHGPSCNQSDINGLMVTLALEGKRVVRLKSGDPGVFGRLTEELAACRHTGIVTEIVPGITAAQGAAASLGLSLTERKTARRLQFVTGHGDDGTLPADLSDSALADPKATTIVYMPRRTLPAISARAIAAGLSPHTPAVAIIAATQPQEVRIAGTIATLPDLVRGRPESGPMLIMIGDALRATTSNLSGYQLNAPGIAA
jgi:uroporphyrin-III C-methyltransferase / precorrin-2 dehydrogenase / sirohydrochlorin ferrochelatase